MPGPFPGMDPWLERPTVFPDVHTRFLNAFSAVLNTRLPPPFYSGVSTRVWLEDSERRVEPDVDVLRPRTPDRGRPTSGGAVAASDLLEIVAPWPDEEHREAFVEVYASPGGERLVTSIELLSRSNKTPGSGGRDLYRTKQQEIARAGVHLLEIDLLRAGTHATLVPFPTLRQKAGAFDYHVCLHRAERRHSFFVAAIALKDRLPRVPVPLTADVPDVEMDLQAVLDRCYEEGLYARRLDYQQALEPPLTREQQAWAEGILRAKGFLEKGKE